MNKMKAAFHILLFAVIVVCINSCNPKPLVPESSAFDFSPKESQYLNVPPSTISFYIEYDGTNFSLKDSKLSNVKETAFDLDLDEDLINSGKFKLAEIQVFNNSGLLIATQLTTIPATIRSNFPDDANTTVLHTEEALSRFSFPFNFKYEAKQLPARISIREVTVANGKIVPLYKQDTLRQMIQLDSLTLKKYK